MDSGEDGHAAALESGDGGLEGEDATTEGTRQRQGRRRGLCDGGEDGEMDDGGEDGTSRGEDDGTGEGGGVEKGENAEEVGKEREGKGVVLGQEAQVYVVNRDVWVVLDHL